MNAAETFVMGLSAAYFFFSVGLGIRVLRRQGVPLGYQGDFTYGAPFLPSRGKEAPSAYVTYFMVACLNEAEVIGATVSGLVDPTGRSRIIVIDDGSDDRTAQIALEAGKGQVILISRCLPDARKGQGAALNSGFTRLVADVQANGHDPEHVVVCVMDADGRLSQGAMAEILPLFDDPYVGGVQLAVRIRNRAANFLLRFQDYQFWSQSAMTQFGRIRTDSVSLGGNGQFARLSALLEAGPRPWSSSLTEDLDLTVTLALRGWKTTSTPRAAVDQQGVETFSALLRQRTRWYQGHMMTARRVPEILSAPDIRHAASVEMTLYILVPWIFDLPWSVLYHLVLIEVALMLGGFRLLPNGSGRDSRVRGRLLCPRILASPAHRDHRPPTGSRAWLLGGLQDGARLRSYELSLLRMRLARTVAHRPRPARLGQDSPHQRTCCHHRSCTAGCFCAGHPGPRKPDMTGYEQDALPRVGPCPL